MHFQCRILNCFRYIAADNNRLNYVMEERQSSGAREDLAINFDTEIDRIGGGLIEWSDRNCINYIPIFHSQLKGRNPQSDFNYNRSTSKKRINKI